MQEGSKLPSTHAFAMVEGHEGRTILNMWIFLEGEANQLNLENISPYSRLLKMIYSLQGTNTVLWILKVKIWLA